MNHEILYWEEENWQWLLRSKSAIHGRVYYDKGYYHIMVRGYSDIVLAWQNYKEESFLEAKKRAEEHMIKFGYKIILDKLKVLL